MEGNKKRKKDLAPMDLTDWRGWLEKALQSVFSPRHNSGHYQTADWVEWSLHPRAHSLQCIKTWNEGGIVHLDDSQSKSEWVGEEDCDELALISQPLTCHTTHLLASRWTWFPLFRAITWVSEERNQSLLFSSLVEEKREATRTAVIKRQTCCCVDP